MRFHQKDLITEKKDRYLESQPQTPNFAYSGMNIYEWLLITFDNKD